MAGELAPRPRCWYCGHIAGTAPRRGRERREGFFSTSLGFFPQRNPTFPCGVQGREAVGAPSSRHPRPTLAPAQAHGSPAAGHGTERRAGDPFPSQPLPLFASTPSFILFYLNNPRGAVAPLPAPPAPRSPGLSTKSCPARGWGRGRGQHRGGLTRPAGATRCHPPSPHPSGPLPHCPPGARREGPTSRDPCVRVPPLGRYK